MATLKTPRLVSIGKLNMVVRGNGNNNDDGNTWSKQVNNDHRPPASLQKGLLALLKHRHA